MAQRGGKRAGAGRKSNAEIERGRGLIDKAVSETDWIAIYAHMARIAKKSKNERAAVFAADFLQRNRFGLPTQIVAGDPDAPPIRIIEVSGK